MKLGKTGLSQALALTVVTAALTMAGPCAARADLILLTREHVDLDIRFEGGALELGLHDEDNDRELAADEGFLFVGPAARTTQPADPRFNFLGAGAGNPVWVLPQVQNPSLLFFGIGTEEIDDGTFRNDEVTLSLRGVRGPGQFSLWATDAFGSPVVFLATSDGITPNDLIRVPTSSEVHFNSGFTAPGLYEIDFQASAVLPNGTPVSSEVTTYFFGVEAVVPAPASLTLLALGCGLAVPLLRRRR
jgi:surface-anchored protein